MEIFEIEGTLIYKLISFVSDHFEWLLVVNGAVLIAFLAALVLLKLREINLLDALHKTFTGALYLFVIGGQLVLIVLLVYTYWQNYHKPAPELHFKEHLLATTQWVKNDTRVYFINDNELRSITVNDGDTETVFSGQTPIKEYHFSPDGKHMVVMTQDSLYLVDLKTKDHDQVDTLGASVSESEQLNGSISGIAWAPDSRKFVYEVARWSKVSTQDNVYVYDLVSQRKRAIRSPSRRISSLYWDRQSENLYYLYHEPRDPNRFATAYEVKIYRIPYGSLKPELVVRIDSDDASVPIENLNLRNIDLFLDNDKLAFGGPGKDNDLVSENGSYIGIDDNDNLYFVNIKWFRKRLYKIIREPRETDIPRYQYKGGDLVIDHIRWIPGGRYVIMEHRYWGVIILEPATAKIGLLIRAHGRAFGWYQKV